MPRWSPGRFDLPNPACLYCGGPCLRGAKPIRDWQAMIFCGNPCEWAHQREFKHRLTREELLEELQKLFGSDSPENIARRLYLQPDSLARRLHRYGMDNLAVLFERVS